MSQWSLAIRIDDDSQNVQVEFVPQQLMPDQYGVVLASVILHIAQCFHESNPTYPVDAIVGQILDGVQAGLAQLPQSAPASQH